MLLITSHMSMKQNQRMQTKHGQQECYCDTMPTLQMPREDEAHLFIEHCLQTSVTPNSLQNNIPSQNLLMIKQTRMISKTDKKISSSCFNILSRSDTASATMLKNLKNIGMQTIHFLAFTKLISQAEIVSHDNLKEMQ